MRAVATLSLLLAAAAGTLLAQHRWRALKTVVPSPAAGAAATASPDDDARPVPAVAKVPEPGSSETLVDDALRAEMLAWRFSQENLSRRGTPHVAAEWRVRRALHAVLERLEPEVPELVQRVALTGGRIIWARHVVSRGELREIHLLSGIVTKLDGRDLDEITAVGRDDYHRQTEPRYREELTRIADSTQAGAIARGMAMALARTDVAVVEELFPRWLGVGGAETITGGLTGEERRLLLDDVALLLPEPVEQTEPTTEDDAPAPTAVFPRTPPRSLDDLAAKLGTARKQVTRRLPDRERERLYRQLVTWSLWLDGPETAAESESSQGADAAGRVASLRRRLGEVLTLLLEDPPP